MSRYLLNIFSLIAVLSLAGCWMGDIGYKMEPMEMKEIEKNLWVKEFDDFTLHAKPITGLIGEWWLSPNLIISSRSKKIIIENIELQTASGIYSAEIKDKTKIVLPFSKRNYLQVYWEFSDRTPTSKILGNVSQIAIHIKVANEKKVVVVKYKKVECC